MTYGTFAPDANGDEYPTPEVVERDFALMAESGINTVRTYTAPPSWLLDLAHEYGLWVMVGLAAERYVGYRSTAPGPRSERADPHGRPWLQRPSFRPGVRGRQRDSGANHSLARSPASPAADWPPREGGACGRPRRTRYLRDVSVDGYLDLPSLDFVCINVYLEERDSFEAYIARMQTLSGDRPLVMGEIGLDSYRNGVEVQARLTLVEVRSAFEAGCAGSFVYAWTDSWYRGGEWGRGLELRVDRARQDGEACTRAVTHRFETVPVAEPETMPRFSVVVCTYNGSGTINSCLKNLLALDYPDYEVIVVDDGSTDSTAAIVGNIRPAVHPHRRTKA